MVRGSPPRVRGKGHPGAATAAGVGITPACAGKRARKTYEKKREEDHPRVCGEKDTAP